MSIWREQNQVEGGIKTWVRVTQTGHETIVEENGKFRKSACVKQTNGVSLYDDLGTFKTLESAKKS